MKIFLPVLYFIVIVFFGACKSVDRKDLSSVGPELVKLTLSVDTNNIKQYLSDSSIVSFNEYDDYFKAYSNLKYEFVTFDTTTFDDGLTYLDLYYKIDSSFHRLECIYVRNEENEISLNSIWLNNISKECTEYLNEIFVPSKYALQARGISWTYKNDRIDRFDLKIYNADISNDYKDVKFKLRVYRGNELVINRTLIIPDIIYSGDTYEFYINELKGMYISPNLTSDNVRFEIDLLESKHPKYHFCEELIRIKEIYSNKSH